MPKKRIPVGRNLDRLQRAAQGKSSALRKDAAKDAAPVVFQINNFEITWDIMPDAELEALPQATRERMNELHELLDKRPPSLTPELRALAARHPRVTCLQNWLINVLRCGSPAERAEARTISERLFHDKPDYFFARTTLADVWLDAGEVDKAAELIFGANSAFTTLYPERKVFHISEFRHWAFVCGRIKILQGEPEVADTYRNMLEELEPGSRAVKELDRISNTRAALISRVIAGLRRHRELSEAKKLRPRTAGKERGLKSRGGGNSD